MSKIKVYRGLTEVAELPLQDGTFAKQLQGSHELSFSTRSASKLDLRIGDTLTYKGELMTINKEPGVSKLSSFQYSTTIVFQGLRHTLERYILKDEGTLTFDYFGTLSDFLLMFLESINASDSGWTFGEVEVTEPSSLSFDRVDCFSALNMIAQAFSCEWQIVGKQITVKKTVGQVTGINVAYGKDNGLYSLSRESIDNARIVNRAFGSGGSNNLPQGYTGKVLRLAEPIEDAASIAMYGVREGAFSDETIFPNRTSTATTVAKINDNTYQLEDSTIDFDLNGQRIDGTEAKIVFKSGALIGEEFKIISYNHANKRIRYEANKDSNGGLMPTGLMVAEVGDSYTLVGIRMPSNYVDAALLALEERTTEYLNSNKIPRVLYKLDIDILDAKRKATYPNEGDFIHVVDADLGIDDDIRVTSIEYPALFPDVLIQGMKFNCEVGNDITYTFVQKIEKDIKETKQVVTQVSKDSWEADRRNVLAIEEFRKMVFDPDGNLQQPMMEALVAYFGTPSQLFTLSPSPTFTMSETEFSLSATTLVHKAYQISPTMYIWDLPAFSQTGLIPEKAYYLSARCSKTTLTGEWVLNETLQTTESEAGFWHFNMGILSSVIDGERSFRATKGFTLISGGQIETDMLTAYMINVVRLFAQEIEATNLKITGNSEVAGFKINEDGLYYAPSSIDGVKFYIKRTGITWEDHRLLIGSTPEVARMQTNSFGSALYLSNSGAHPLNAGLKINMGAENKNALDIEMGRIKVTSLAGNEYGINTVQPFNDGSGVKYLHINKGLITSITDTNE
ncbi:phage tail protein [Sphingobacterium sp. 1.A.5]|uniref:phage tail protein n=1 Tax=Sphingobacterium sp. 1.A.5 TaxID=2044604 RepID=UPI000C0BEAC7|nr:phage tail protein [Sphingobacterium sp. 1.A.5]